MQIKISLSGPVEADRQGQGTAAGAGPDVR